MLDVVVGVADQTRDQDLAVGYADFSELTPLVHVPGVHHLERVRAGVDLEGVLQGGLQRDVGQSRPVVEAVARVVADPVFGDVAQRVVDAPRRGWLRRAGGSRPSRAGRSACRSATGRRPAG